MCLRVVTVCHRYDGASDPSCVFFSSINLEDGPGFYPGNGERTVSLLRRTVEVPVSVKSFTARAPITDCDRTDALKPMTVKQWSPAPLSAATCTTC